MAVTDVPNGESMMRLPIVVRGVLGVCGLLLGLTALALIGAGLRWQAWSLVGFELTVLIAAAFAIVMSRPRTVGSPVLALTCIAGTVAVASVLGVIGVHQRRLGGVSLDPVVLSRLLLAGLIMASVLVLLITGDRRSAGLLARSVALAAPVVAVAGILVLPQGAALSSAIGGLPGPILAAVVVFGFLILAVLLAAAVQTAIRGVEMGLAGLRSTPSFEGAMKSG